MTLSPSRRSHHRVLIIAGLFGLALLAAPSFVGQARAFTIDEQANTNPNGSAKFSDPDQRLFGNGDGNSRDGTTTFRNGNTSLQFGTQRPSSFDRNYSTEHIFSPNGRPGDDR